MNYHDRITHELELRRLDIEGEKLLLEQDKHKARIVSKIVSVYATLIIFISVIALVVVLLVPYMKGI